MSRLFAAALATAALLPAAAQALSLLTVTGTLYESTEFDTPSGVFAAGGTHALPTGATFVMTMELEDGGVAVDSEIWDLSGGDLTLSVFDGGALVYATSAPLAGARLITNEVFGVTPAEPPFNVPEGVWDHFMIGSLPDGEGLEVGLSIFAPLGSLGGEGFAAAALEGWVGGLIGVANADRLTQTDGAAASITSVSVSAIPLPAGAPLALAGLGALALLRRRA